MRFAAELGEQLKIRQRCECRITSIRARVYVAQSVWQGQEMAPVHQETFAGATFGRPSELRWAMTDDGGRKESDMA